MADGRETRKGFTGDSMGGGFTHVPGTPWPKDKWEAFVAWAIGHGATPMHHGYEELGIKWDDGRDDGPAYLWPDGYTRWQDKNGHFHREDGPAVVNEFGHETWWKNDVRYTDGTFTEKIQ